MFILLGEYCPQIFEGVAFGISLVMKTICLKNSFLMLGWILMKLGIKK
jgi:hypothetical protein